MFTYDKGVCVQCTLVGSYDYELKTFVLMLAYLKSNGYALDITDNCYHRSANS